MKKLSLAVAFALTIAMMAVLSAQQAPSSMKGDKVTVTGCVQQAAPAKPTGTSGDTSTTTPDTKFVLTAPVTGMSGQTATGTTGAASPTGKVLYRLDDADQAKVSAHEGHKVEIMGTVLEAGQAAQAQAGEEDKPQSATTPNVQAPKLKVDSVKMIASTCSQQ